jgi:6-phosphogluconolactonase
MHLGLATACLLVHRPARADQQHLFVSFAGERRIAVYSIDAHQGTLTHARDVAIEGHAGSLATDPGRNFLFAALREEGRLASFRLDARMGALAPISNIPAGEDPAYVATDRSGRYLLTAYYVAAKVTVHAIDADGRLSERPVQSIETAKNAHAILTDQANRFVFVPHTSPNAIFQFRFDAATGRLAANDPPVLQRPEQTGPRHIVFHPRLPVAYVDNEQGSSVTWYRFDQDRGTLAAEGTASTLPEGARIQNSNADVEVHPSGRFLYCSNRGHDSLAMFAVDEKSGALTALGQVPTAKTPREFNIDPAGKLLFAAGESSGEVVAYRIAGDGRLSRLARYAVGKAPFWVLVVAAE